MEISRSGSGEPRKSGAEQHIERYLRDLAIQRAPDARNAAGKPAADVLAFILTGCRTWQAALRRLLGDADFRNVRNFAQGRVKRSSRVAVLTEQFTPAVFEFLVEIARDPATAQVPRVLSALESILVSYARELNSYPLPWRDADARNGFGEDLVSGHAERDVIERACLAAVGAELFLRTGMDELLELVRTVLTAVSRDLVSNDSSSAANADQQPRSELMDHVTPLLAAIKLLLGFSPASEQSPSVWDLANPAHHPFTNWIRELMKIVGVENPSALVNKTVAAVTADSAMRYHRGEMLTVEAARRLTNGQPKAAALLTATAVARALALAIERLQSADRRGALSSQHAVRLVGARLRDFYFDVQVVIMRVTRRRERIALAALNETHFCSHAQELAALTLEQLDGPPSAIEALLRPGSGAT